MLLQAALNGPFTARDHPAMPTSVEELARDAAACVASGARAIHLHPRDAEGAESLTAETVDSVVSAVRARCGVPTGVSTGAWIEPDLERRIALVSAWTQPDYASVNVSEDGAEAIMAALLSAGIGIEAGVVSVEDAQRLAGGGLAQRVTRILVEPVDVSRLDAVATADAIHAALDRAGIVAPRLQHGDGEATWVLITDAVQRGLDTRVGLEDTLLGPDGGRTSGNPELIRDAVALGAGASEQPL